MPDLLRRPLLGLLVAGAFAATPALAQAPAAPDRPAISVTAQGTARAVPDMATTQLSVVRQAATTSEAIAAGSAAMAEVIAAMKEMGIAERDLQTSNFSVQPNYDEPPQRPDGTRSSPQISGYTVTQSLQVRVRDLARLGEVLSKAVELGVNQDGGFQLSNSEPDAVLAEARRDAVERARDKARTLAEAAGITLGDVLSIEEQGGYGMPVPMQRMSAMAAEARAVPIEAGENEYTVDILMRFGIGQ